MILETNTSNNIEIIMQKWNDERGERHFAFLSNFPNSDTLRFHLIRKINIALLSLNVI